MWIWRRMEKICWTEHITNEEVTVIEEEKAMIRTMAMRQRKWIGHILIGDLQLRTVIEGKMEGKKTRGRPRQMDWMMAEGYGKLKEEAKQGVAGDVVH